MLRLLRGFLKPLTFKENNLNFYNGDFGFWIVLKIEHFLRVRLLQKRVIQKYNDNSHVNIIMSQKRNNT